jgi:hydroxymethylglutaryl-CoA lyase
MEVGPRDGLQNEKRAIPPATKVELINKLANAGLTRIEAGSFVSPKWVPQVRWFRDPVYVCWKVSQMAGTSEVIIQMEHLPGVRYPVLVPNIRGLENLLAVLSEHPSSLPPPTDEVAVFISATDAFSKANTNCTVTESLQRTSEVVRLALEKGLRVRGYLSVVIACPYSGPVDYRKVRDLTKQLLDMGCYEVSLGDTTGVGNPSSVSEMLAAVISTNPVERLAVSHKIHSECIYFPYANVPPRVM